MFCVRIFNIYIFGALQFNNIKIIIFFFSTVSSPFICVHSTASTYLWGAKALESECCQEAAGPALSHSSFGLVVLLFRDLYKVLSALNLSKLWNLKNLQNLKKQTNKNKQQKKQHHEWEKKYLVEGARDGRMSYGNAISCSSGMHVFCKISILFNCSLLPPADFRK